MGGALIHFLAGLRVPARMAICAGAVVIGCGIAVSSGGDAYGAQSAAPGPQCEHALPAYRDWTPQEVWAWSAQICRGVRADMSMYGGGDGNPCDPAQSADWPGTRKLSADFLYTILDTEPYRGALHRSGVQIRCAQFSAPVDLSNMVMARPLRLTDSVFSGDLLLASARIPGELSLDGSTVKGRLSANSLTIDGNLSMRGNARFNSVRLTGARVAGWMNLSGATVEGLFDAERLQVRDSMSMAGPARFAGEVRLVSARVGGELRANGAVFDGLFSAARLQTVESLFMRQASFKNIRLIGARIGGSLHLRQAVFDGDFDLTSASIDDELQLNTPAGNNADPGTFGPPQWSANSRLILRNTHVGALNDTIDSWDNVKLDLVGFTYDRLGGLRATRDSIMAARPKEWMLENWLAKQEGFTESFIPQPFEQLATILRKNGYPAKADYLMMEKLTHLRDSPQTTLRKKASLWLQYVLIGYGYRNWQAFLWFIGLAALGAWVCGRSPEGRGMRRSQRFWYSVDIAVPVFDLDKKHAAITLTERCSIYFYFHKAAGFILISFVIAGLSGLTR